MRRMSGEQVRLQVPPKLFNFPSPLLFFLSLSYISLSLPPFSTHFRPQNPDRDLGSVRSRPSPSSGSGAGPQTHFHARAYTSQNASLGNSFPNNSGFEPADVPP